MLSLVSKSNQCIYKDSIFAFLVDLMLSHHEMFGKVCYLCPFGFCYRKFMVMFALIRLASSLKELAGLLKNPDAAGELMVNIPLLEIPLTRHNFHLLVQTFNVSSFLDLLMRAMTAESAQELVTFGVFSFAMVIYMLVRYVLEFKSLNMEGKIVRFVLNFTEILNLMFLTCFIFEVCKHNKIASVNLE